MNYLKILILICLSGCFNAKKSIQKLERKAPEKLAEYCGKEFPVKETIKIDTAYEFLDLVCPDPLVKTDTIIGKDTIIIKQNSIIAKTYKNGIVKVPIRTITITSKDTASLKLAAIEIQKQKDNADKLANKLTSTRNWLLLLVVALAISVVLNVILIRR
jgi:hypothetical protein